MSERSVKSYVISRKNFLFAVTTEGGEASAIFLTLIETAKENGLDPQKYLTWVLQNIHTTEPSKLMPWNAPDPCKAGQMKSPTRATNAETGTGVA